MQNGNYQQDQPPAPDRRLAIVFGASILLAVSVGLGLWLIPPKTRPVPTVVQASLPPDPPDLSACEGWARLSIARPASFEREVWQRAGLDGSTGSAHVITLSFWTESALGNRTRRKAICRFEGGLAPDGAQPWLVGFELDGKVPRAFRETMAAAQ